MIDRQLEDFASRDRFADAVLGLLSATERVRVLAGIRATRPVPATPAAGAIADVLLGMISVGRSLRATLGFAAAEPVAPDPEPHPREGGVTDHRILR